MVDAGGVHWIDAALGTGQSGPCENMATPTTPTGDHNSGNNCLDGCHNHGFTIAGTLYASSNPNVSTVFGGAHVTVTDANNKVIDMVASTLGNFNTTESVAFPVTIIASACPSSASMTASASNGACNASGCHPGHTTTQIHLP